MKRVEFSRSATKTLLRMDRATARRIVKKVDLLARDPAQLANNVRALRGQQKLKRLRVGDWRIIFSEDLVVLLVIRIAPRGSAYD